MDNEPQPPATVYTEYIDTIKRGGTRYVGSAVDAPVESVGPATEFCRPCYAYVQLGHTCPTWTKQKIEAHVRKLLGLGVCDCGQGLYCQEISLNGLDRAEEVLAYLKEVDQDAVVAYLQERWAPR